MWKYEEITHINLEVSSICNAACPWCPRYVDMSTNVNPEIDVGYISLEKFKKYFPEDKKQTNLQNWATFEEKHPNTFGGMYQFWVSKTEN